MQVLSWSPRILLEVLGTCYHPKSCLNGAQYCVLPSMLAKNDKNSCLILCFFKLSWFKVWQTTEEWMQVYSFPMLLRIFCRCYDVRCTSLCVLFSFPIIPKNKFSFMLMSYLVIMGASALEGIDFTIKYALEFIGMIKLRKTLFSVSRQHILIGFYLAFFK